MRHRAFHGSPSEAFSTFDPARTGRASGYAHAQDTAAFTSAVAVAEHYAGPDGFVGEFAFVLDHPLECDDRDRPMGLAAWIAHARSMGHDGVILRACAHTAISPGEPSDIFILFDVTRASLVTTVQDPTPPDAPPERGPSSRSPARGRRS